MLIEDLEQNIYAIGGKKLEYKDLIENLDEYYYFPKGQDERKAFRQKLNAQEFFSLGTEANIPSDCTCLYYYLPYRELTEIEKQETEKFNKHVYNKKILLYAASFDNQNIDYICPMFPPFVICEDMDIYYKHIMGRKIKMQEIENNINALDGKKIEYKEMQKEIGSYVYYLQDEPRYDIYCHNAIDRLKSMTENELVYYLTNKPFRNDYQLFFYYISYKEEHKNKDTEFIKKYKYQLNGLDNKLVSVKEILVILGSYNTKDLEYFKIFFPFDMLEEKQKEIKEFILHGKK